MLNNSILPPNPPWIVPTLLNSWVNYGSGYMGAQYFKDALGFVHISGLIKNGTTTAVTTLFTLPVGYRPLSNLVINTISNNAGPGALTTIEIVSDGTVRIGGLASGATYLSITITPFLAEQ